MCILEWSQIYSYHHNYINLIFHSYGVVSFILFPKVADELKTNYAEEAYNPNGIVPRAVKLIKEKFPQVVVCTDIALDPYSSMVSTDTSHAW